MKKKILIAGAVAVAVLGAATYFVLCRTNTWSSVRSDSATTTVQNEKDRSVENIKPFSTDMKDWKTYRNKEVGISFKYPDIFEREDFYIKKGDEGRMLIGVLALSPDYYIGFGGATKDYRYPQGGSIDGTLGYEKKGERYFIKFLWDKSEITPSEFWPVNSGKDQALVVRNTEIGQVLSVEEVAAFVNIPNSDFPGVAFYTSPQNIGEQVDERTVQIMKQIVSSITFEE